MEYAGPRGYFGGLSEWMGRSFGSTTLACSSGCTLDGRSADLPLTYRQYRLLKGRFHDCR